MTYVLMTPSQVACKLAVEHISEVRVRTMHTTAGIGLVQGPAHGTELSDLDGNSYIDCRSAGGVFNLGHTRAEIAEVLARAVQDTDMGDWMLLSSIRATTAQHLAALAPAGLDYVQFGVTGSEAVEVACKLARGTTGRQTIITMENAYHGFSGFSLATAPAHITAPYGPLTPGIVQVPHGDLDVVARTIDANTAAVLLETVQGSGGVILPPDGYLQGLRDLCDAHGVLLICDEVQAGMGRTGKLFSFEHWGVLPDMAVVGKALGGGYYPISACLYNARVLDFVNTHPLAHPSTFSGSEIGCLVAQKAMGLLSAPELLANVSEMGARLSAGYRRLQADFPELIQTHRQIGLFTGIDTTSPEVGMLLRHAAVRHGLIAFTAPFRPQFLQIWPPLIITADETDELLLRLTMALAETATQIRNTHTDTGLTGT